MAPAAYHKGRLKCEAYAVSTSRVALSVVVVVGLRAGGGDERGGQSDRPNS
jgi:hypothetical protein